MDARCRRNPGVLLPESKDAGQAGRLGHLGRTEDGSDALIPGASEDGFPVGVEFFHIQVGMRIGDFHPEGGNFARRGSNRFFY